VAERGKALVTGGAGFIGSHLSAQLLADGWEVYALDDLSTGNLRNVARLRDRADYHLVVDSVLSPSIVNELVHKCDVVFHLAAAVGVRLIVEQPVHTLVTARRRSSSRPTGGSTARRRRAAGSTPTRRRWTSSSRSATTTSAGSTA
jgi:uncharacterized protein YbjT (DUF2867 family)